MCTGFVWPMIPVNMVTALRSIKAGGFCTGWATGTTTGCWWSLARGTAALYTHTWTRDRREGRRFLPWDICVLRSVARSLYWSVPLWILQVLRWKRRPSARIEIATECPVISIEPGWRRSMTSLGGSPLLGRPRRTLEDNIQMNLIKMLLNARYSSYWFVQPLFGTIVGQHSCTELLVYL